MSSIVTFYSYKGGVGRSMALANIAVLLARRGLKVLAVDWDLEAPGLERYFSYFDIKPGGPGLLRMFMDARDTGSASYVNFTSSVDSETKHPIVLLASGREQDEAYSSNLEAFDWEAFFARNGGAFVESLRNQWRETFDVILIDSRTGLSDTGGICTIQLPDIVVAMFTANYQSLYGVRDVLRLAQRARQGLAYDRMPLSILPLAARWGTQEFQETQLWLDRVAECVQEFCDDWLPRTLRARDVVERLKIPQASYFAFGEKLAVVEQGTSDPQGMGFVYEKVAAFLASDFADVGTLVGEQALTSAAAAQPALKAPDTTDYKYDIFVSHDGSNAEWLLGFIDTVKASLAERRSEAPRVFVNVREIRIGELWEEDLRDALLQSKVLLALMTPNYARNQFATMEWLTFQERGRQTGTTLLLPVILRGDGADFPHFMREYQWLDLRKLSLRKTFPRFGSWPRELMELVETLDTMLARVPRLDPQWKIVSKVPDYAR